MAHRAGLLAIDDSHDRVERGIVGQDQVVLLDPPGHVLAQQGERSGRSSVSVPASARLDPGPAADKMSRSRTTSGWLPLRITTATWMLSGPLPKTPRASPFRAGMLEQVQVIGRGNPLAAGRTAAPAPRPARRCLPAVPPASVSLSSLYAADLCQAAAWASSPSNSRYAARSCWGRYRASGAARNCPASVRLPLARSGRASSPLPARKRVPCFQGRPMERMERFVDASSKFLSPRSARMAILQKHDPVPRFPSA